MKRENKIEKVERIPETVEVAKLLKYLGQSLITMLKEKQKVTKKHITNNEAHEVKSLMGIKRKNFDNTRKRKVQINPNPKPNNF